MDIEQIRRDATTRKEAAEAEAKRWEEFLAGLALLVDENGKPALKALRADRSTALPLNEGGGRLKITERVAVTILAEEGRALSTGELLDKLVERGIEIGGRSPISTLSARLSRANALSFVAGYGWTLVAPGRENGDAGKNPDGETAPPTRSDHNHHREGDGGGGT